MFFEKTNQIEITNCPHQENKGKEPPSINNIVAKEI